MPRLPRFNPHNDGRLAYAVSQSPRLTALLPADGLEPLLDVYNRAVGMAADADKVTFTADDAAAEVREALRSGEDVDIAAVVERMTRAQASQAAHRQAVAFFKSLPADAHRGIVSFINASEDDLYEGLAAELADVLDRAESVVAALSGVRDAESAIVAKLTGQWSALRNLSGEYHDIASAFRSLLMADETQMVRVDSTRVAFALFGGLADSAPTFAAEAQSKPTDLRGRPVTDVPFDVLATDSLDHFRYVVENRDRLRPRIVRADEALNPPTVIRDDPMVVAAPREHGRLAPGTPEFERAMTRARRAAANRTAAERTERAAWGDMPDLN
ncbi:hypothetical protein [Geodermatophilus sp. URMC 64]